jgi:hypothetical protein
MSKPFQALNVLMALVFVLGAAVQYNDPDPLGWMLVYLAAALACGLAVTGRLRWPLPALVSGVALLWAGTLASPVLAAHVPFFRLFSQWEMTDARIEETREMYGLLFIAGWMALLAVTGARRMFAAKGNE